MRKGKIIKLEKNRKLTTFSTNGFDFESKYENPLNLKIMLEKFWDFCKSNENIADVIQDESGNILKKIYKVPKVENLASFLGICKKTLKSYENCDNEKHKTRTLLIKEALAKLDELVADELVQPSKNSNITGLIFYAKNQGWADKKELDFSDKTEMTQEQIKAKADKIKNMIKKEIIEE